MVNYKTRSLTPMILAENTPFEGKLLGFKFHEGRTHYIFEAQTGDHVLIWGSSQLQETIYKSDVGKRMMITYKGKIDLKNGKTLKQYDVGVEENGKPEESMADNETATEGDDKPY